MCCLLLTACGTKPTITSGATPTASAAETMQTTVITEPVATAETAEPQEVFLTVYSPDENLAKFEKTEVLVEAITESAIIKQLTLAGVLTDGIQVNSFALVASSETSDTVQLQIDFNDAFRDLILTQGSAGEHAIIGSVVNTFLTAYNAQNMVISVEGELLESGHFVYDIPLEFYN